MVRLYVGLEAPSGDDVLHVPLIKIVPKSNVDCNIPQETTHIIVTSKTTVAICTSIFAKQSLPFISVGRSTTLALTALGISNVLTASNECQEGIIQLIDAGQFTQPHFFWPHSSLSRPTLKKYFLKKGYAFTECTLYDTVFTEPTISVDLQKITQIHFTSPSTVDAYFQYFGAPPSHVKLHTIGPVTKAHLDHKIKGCAIFSK